MLKKLFRGILYVALLAGASRAHAMSIDGAGTIMVLPVIAQTPTFTSEVTVFNPQSATVDYTVQFYGANGTATVGAVACSNLTIPANTAVQFSLASQCPSLNPGSNFGRMTISEQALTSQPFFVYSRVSSNCCGEGFSIEGFPVGTFEGGTGYVTGLRRQAAAPGYQTNCFVASNGEAAGYRLVLKNGATGAQIGAALTGALGANEMIRFLDIFSAVGAAPGDYSNVRAEISEDTTGEPTVIGFCTVQENVSFGSDFRIAKTLEPHDQARQRSVSASATRLGQPFTVILNGPLLTKNTHVVYFRHPDRISCSLTGANTAQLEMQIKDPENNVVGGGNNLASTGEFATGAKSAVNGGTNGRWLIEVSGRSELILPIVLPYGITCTSGNGSTFPDLIDTSLLDDF